jgi:hypothetical protein
VAASSSTEDGDGQEIQLLRMKLQFLCLRQHCIAHRGRANGKLRRDILENRASGTAGKN